jgi:hypothetical protein
MPVDEDVSPLEVEVEPVEALEDVAELVSSLPPSPPSSPQATAVHARRSAPEIPRSLVMVLMAVLLRASRGCWR